MAEWIQILFLFSSNNNATSVSRWSFFPPKRLNHSGKDRVCHFPFQRTFSTTWLFQVFEKKEEGRENKDHLYDKVGNTLALLLHSASHKEKTFWNNGRSSRVTKGILERKAKTISIIQLGRQHPSRGREQKGLRILEKVAPCSRTWVICVKGKTSWYHGQVFKRNKVD